MSTDLVVAARPSAVVPANEWLLMSKQAELLAQSDIIPAAYRRKPANIMVAALTGRSHGWDVMTAMRNGHVVEGTWALRPEAMLGLVRRAGHSVTAEVGVDGATLHGKRCDSGDELTVGFTIDDAKRAGLANKQVWRNYPQSMCYWRAVGMLCRFLFSDVTLGLMSAEEMGADISESGDVIDAPSYEQEPVALGAEAMAKFVEACEVEGLDPNEVMERAFPNRELDDPVLDTELPHLRDVFRVMAAEIADLAKHEGTEPEPNFVNDEIGGGTTGAGDEPRPASRGQVGLIKAAYERMNMDRDDQLTTTSAVIARDIKSHNELSADEASKVLDYLDGQEP